MDNDKIPTLYVQPAEQLRPFMSTRQRAGRQRNRGSILGKDETHTSSPKGQTGSVIYSTCQQVPQTLSLELQRSGFEAEYSSSSVAVKNECSNTNVPAHAFIGRTEPELPVNVFMLPLVACTTPCFNNGEFSYHELFPVLKRALQSEMSLTSCPPETTSLLSRYITIKNLFNVCNQNVSLSPAVTLQHSAFCPQLVFVSFDYRNKMRAFPSAVLKKCLQSSVN
jgi:hypothetical protein